MAPPRRNSRKSPNIFSHEFIRKNYGDIVGCILMIVMGATYFEATKKYFSKFTFFSYSEAIVGVQKTLYGIGKEDLFLLFNYSLICILATAVFNEYISDKIIPALHLSMKKAWELRHKIQKCCFHLFWIIVTCIVWTEKYFELLEKNIFSLEKYNEDLLNTLPVSRIDIYMKLLYVISLSFPFAMLANIYFWKIKPKFYFRIFLESFLMFSIAYIVYFSKLGLFGIDLVSLYIYSVFFLDVAKIVHTAKSNNGIFVFASVLAFILAVSCSGYAFFQAKWVYNYGIGGSKDDVMTINIIYGVIIVTQVLLFANVLSLLLKYNFFPKKEKEDKSNRNKSAPRAKSGKSRKND